MAFCCGHELNINDVVDGYWVCPTCGKEYYFDDDEDEDEEEPLYEEHWPEEFYDSL